MNDAGDGATDHRGDDVVRDNALVSSGMLGAARVAAKRRALSRDRKVFGTSDIGTIASRCAPTTPSKVGTLSEIAKHLNRTANVFLSDLAAQPVPYAQEIGATMQTVHLRAIALWQKIRTSSETPDFPLLDARQFSREIPGIEGRPTGWSGRWERAISRPVWST